MGRPKKELTDGQKFTILKHAVAVIKTHCLQTKDCADCLLLGKYPPHNLTDLKSGLVAQCPFEYGEKPCDWQITKDGHEIFMDMLPEDLYDSVYPVKPLNEPAPTAVIPNQPGSYECVEGRWIRV